MYTNLKVTFLYERDWAGAHPTNAILIEFEIW